MTAEFQQQLQRALPASLAVKFDPIGDMPCLRVEPGKLLDLCKFLCRDERFEFHHCSGITAYDDYPTEPRFTVVYQLYSYKLLQPIRVKAQVSDEELTVPSVVEVWSTANCHERETYDMFGIQFKGHPHLTRIFMPEEYPYHPLRKDFPWEGIEPDRLYREWEQNRET